jgi:uncharacterized protein (DUF58 family)
MSTAHEFHYRLPHRVSGWRPGSHPGSSLGGGQEFVTHMRLLDRSDPRRVDIRASLRDLRGDWLVRVNRQRSSIPVYAVVDVSASMRFGVQRPKLHVVADFVEALGTSTYRAGDLLGMYAFDRTERSELFVPPILSRGIGMIMAQALRACTGGAAGIEGLAAVLQHLAGRQGLVFLASDFHWPLERLGSLLDLLAHAYVVPMVVWSSAEVRPPGKDGVAFVEDAETGAHRTLWLRPRLREQWLDAIERRREELEHIFTARGMRPFYLGDEFNSEAMSRYFLEAVS